MRARTLVLLALAALALSRAPFFRHNPDWGLLKPGEEATARGKIYLLKGTLAGLWQRYEADFLKAGGRL